MSLSDTAITLPAYVWKAIIHAAAEFSADPKYDTRQTLQAVFFETESDKLIVTTADGFKLQSLELPYKPVMLIAHMIPIEAMLKAVRDTYRGFKASELHRFQATLTFKADVAIFGLGDEEMTTHASIPYTSGTFPNYRRLFDAEKGHAPSNRVAWSPGQVAALCRAADTLGANIVKQTSDDEKPLRYSYTGKLYDVTVIARAMIMPMLNVSWE